MRERTRGVVLGGDHVDRDVARGQVVLQPVEHPPAVDVRQLDVQRDGVDPGRALDERQRVGALVATSGLEPVLVGQVHQESREVTSFSTISRTRSSGPIASRSSWTSCDSRTGSAPAMHGVHVGHHGHDAGLRLRDSRLAHAARTAA